LEEIVLLKNLIDNNNEEKQSNSKLPLKEKEKEKQDEKEKPLMKKTSNLLNSQLKKELTQIGNIDDKKIKNEKDLRISPKKTTGILKRSSTVLKQNLNVEKILKKNDKSINNSKLMNSTLNNNSSFNSHDSKKLDRNASKSRLKTGGNENTSSKVFNKMFEKKETLKNISKINKDNTNNLKKINRSPSIGKLAVDNIQSKINTGLSEEFKRKSFIKQQEKKSENINKSINLTMAQSILGLGDKKKPNFIS
jgi:hypothetical protein